MENVKGLEEVQKTLVSIGSILEKIHTRHIIKICLHYYCYTTILCDGLCLMHDLLEKA